MVLQMKLWLKISQIQSNCKLLPLGMGLITRWISPSNSKVIMGLIARMINPRISPIKSKLIMCLELIARMFNPRISPFKSKLISHSNSKLSISKLSLCLTRRKIPEQECHLCI